MQLPLQSFSVLVQNMAASVQAAATQLLDLTVGSTLRAVLEANASVALWMQWLVVQVLQMTRAATSSGADLDSWMADFSLVRLPASPASGTVTLSRFTTGSTALIPVGALVRTADGSQTFAVSADSTNASWDPTQQGYAVAAGAASVDVPIVAQAAGTAGNVLAGTISMLVSAIPGIDAASNTSALSNGIDAESDPAFRARFQNFLSTRSRATPLAVGYAISSLQQGLNYVVQENIDPSGATRMGNFLVYLDDGSGFPSDALLSAAQTVIEAVRPVGSTFAVFAPRVTTVNVGLTLAVTPGINTAPIISSLVASLTAYINGLPLGTALPVTKIAQLAYLASPYVNNVTGISLNGQAADIVVPASGVIKSGTVVVG